MSTPKTLTQHAVTWALAALFVFVVLALNATLDGPSETDAARDVAADLKQAPADQRMAMRGTP